MQIAHFFTAINPAFPWTFLATSSLCAGGIIALRFRTILVGKGEFRALPLLVKIVLLVAVARLPFRPVFNITTQEIIVPGLGNLLLNFAFNQSPFLVASLFDSLSPHLRGYSLFGGILPWQTACG